MATIYEDDKGKLYAFVKGAPDFMKPVCSYFVDAESKIAKITEDFEQKYEQAIQEFAQGSLRTLCIAYKELKTVPEEWSQVENGLIVLAVVGIKDPLRDGIKEAVTQCHEGGVTVRMVTGDNKITAIAIAKEAGILPEDWVPTEGDYTVM